jgi:iron complex transport system substrate-binding protein
VLRRITPVLAAALCAAGALFPGAVAARAASMPPSCVVSLSPTATETLFAIGAGPQVKAVDSDSNYPSAGLPAKRINALNPSVESIIGICPSTAAHPSTKPDLVIISYDANTIKEKLSALGVKVVEQDAATSVAAALGQIRQLGVLTGHRARADALAASLERTITADIASVPAHPKKAVRVYYELDPTYYSLTSSTFVGSLLKALGLVNIADAQSTSADAGYPQLSAEYIVSADPQLIFLADTKCCHVTPAVVAKRPGFDTVSAVVHGHVVNLDDDVASRWGPRLGLLMDQLTAAVKSVLADSRLWR